MSDKEKILEEIAKDRAFFYRVAYRFTKNQDSANDLLQDTLLRAFEKSYQFKGGSLRAWVKKIMFTKFLRLCEIHARVQFCDIDEAYDIAGKETVDIVVVGEAIDKLDDLQQTLLTLYVEGYDYDEISKYTNMPVSTARVKIHRAKERIRLMK